MPEPTPGWGCEMCENGEACVHCLRAALDMAVYHAENLRRYIDMKLVRDLAESEAGFKKARTVLRGPDA